MKLVRIWRNTELPYPGLEFFFEERCLALGVAIKHRYCDPVASLGAELELTERQADLLARFLFIQGRRLCRLIGHKPHWVANPGNGDAAWLQCRRCYLLAPREEWPGSWPKPPLWARARSDG